MSYPEVGHGDRGTVLATSRISEGESASANRPAPTQSRQGGAGALTAPTRAASYLGPMPTLSICPSLE